MLRQLKLANFRGFRTHTLPFRHLAIVVGKNNAGKSTIVEALRLIAVVTARYRNLPYKYPPSWTGLPRRSVGVSPSLKGLGLSFASLFHRYADPPAFVTAEFADGSEVVLYIRDEDSVFAVIRASDGEIVRSKSQAARHNLPSVGILPQITPVAREEGVLNEEYVKRSLSSPLFSAHFRNQVRIFPEVYQQFCETVESTWPGVRVHELICESNLPGKPIYLEVRNEDFVAEISAMGHGLQMWLQTIWFLTRSAKFDTVILDEPDVYMHPDLQRRIIRHLRTKSHQVIIATHSVEILSEVEPDDILVVDRSRSSSEYADSLPAVQVLANNIGTAHNLHLTRIWRSNKFILIEGKDLKILKHFQNILFPGSDTPFDAVPNMSIGGWGGWHYAIGSSLALKNSLGADLKAYCVLDSDYHSDEEIAARRREARGKDVALHIWERKEIENYLICPTALVRVIQERASRRTMAPSVAEIEGKIVDIAESFREVVFDGFASSCLSANRSLGSGGANKLARQILKEREARDGGLLGMVSGKAVLAELSKWSQEEFGVSFSSAKIARAIHATEIPEEVANVVAGLELGNEIT